MRWRVSRREGGREGGLAEGKREERRRVSSVCVSRRPVMKLLLGEGALVLETWVLQRENRGVVVVG